VETLGQQTGRLDLGKWISYYTFDFMGDLVFGGGFEMMKEGGDSAGLWRIIIEGMKISGILFHIPWISQFLNLIPVGSDFFRMLSFANERMDIRTRSGSITKDLFYHFADEEKLKPQPPSRGQIQLDTMVVIIAGSDTTSSSMSNVFYHLLAHPSVLKRLQAEVDGAFQRDEEIKDQMKLAGMPYLNACINEALRLFPPVPSWIERTPAKGSGGVIISGRFIPEGTTLNIPPYTLQRNPQYFFPMPDQFWPERWLLSSNSESTDIDTEEDDNSEKDDKYETVKEHRNDTPSSIIHNTDAFIPFSHGPANCIGKRLAYREMRLVIATVLQKYEIRFADGYDKERWIREIREDGVIVKGDLPVSLKPRF